VNDGDEEYQLEVQLFVSLRTLLGYSTTTVPVLDVKLCGKITDGGEDELSFLGYSPVVYRSLRLSSHTFSAH
jgi:hypothetical protein